METLKKPAVVFVAGVLIGYMLTRVLDQVPVVNRLPKIRI